VALTQDLWQGAEPALGHDELEIERRASGGCLHVAGVAEQLGPWWARQRAREMRDLALRIAPGRVEVHRTRLAVHAAIDVEVDVLYVPRGSRDHEHAIDVSRRSCLRRERQPLSADL